MAEKFLVIPLILLQFFFALKNIAQAVVLKKDHSIIIDKTMQTIRVIKRLRIIVINGFGGSLNLVSTYLIHLPSGAGNGQSKHRRGGQKRVTTRKNWI